MLFIHISPWYILETTIYMSPGMWGGLQEMIWDNCPPNEYNSHNNRKTTKSNYTGWCNLSIRDINPILKFKLCQLICNLKKHTIEFYSHSFAIDSISKAFFSFFLLNGEEQCHLVLIYWSQSNPMQAVWKSRQQYSTSVCFSISNQLTMHCIAAVSKSKQQRSDFSSLWGFHKVENNRIA